MKYITSFIFVLVFVTSNSCSNEIIYNKVTKVNYGTSFGMCVGYCKREVTVDSMNTTYNCVSWNPDLKPLTTTNQTPKLLWDSARVLVNSKEFFLLPATIGCPDCADGGAEWLELKLANGEIHKVTFEYNKEPELLKNYLIRLRGILKKNDCN